MNYVSEIILTVSPYKGDVFAILTAVCWAIAVIFFKLSENRYSATELNIVKNNICIGLFVISIAVFYPYWKLDLSLSEWGLIFLSSFTGIIVGDIFFLMALKELGASLQAIVDMLFAPLMIILTFIFFSETLSLWQLVGGGMILSSILIISFPVKKGPSEAHYLKGFLLGFFAQLACVVSILLIRDIFKKHSVVHLTLYRFIIGNVLLMGFFFIKNKSIRPLIAIHRVKKGIGILFLSSFFGSFLAVYFWFLGYKFAVAGVAAIYNQLSNVLIVILAVIFLKEKLNSRKAFAVLVAFLGALVVGLN